MPSKLSRLLDKLATDGGSESTDLALDLVLNEIVQQVRITTRATGAAIALLRGEEMVCRATTGGNAPDLGVRLDTKTGLSGACVQSRQTQICGDTELDDRVDVAACRALGVRSILVMPLLAGDHLVGVFEVFSPLPRAFGDRDVQTLEAFVQQILGTVEEAKALSHPEAQSAPVRSNYGEPELPSLAPRLQRDDGDGGPPPLRRDLVTPVLTLIVIGLAILLGTLLGMHITRKKRSGLRAPQPIANTAVRPDSSTESQTTAANSPTAPPKDKSAGNTASSNEGISVVHAPGQENPSAGGLVVYQNGRVVYQAPPSAPGASSTAAAAPAAQPKVPVEQPVVDPGPLPNLVEVPPDAAKSMVLSRREPEYPPEVLTGRVQGSVQIRVAVDRAGAVQSARFAGGPPTLAPAALDAVKQWHFAPYSVDGNPVEFQTIVTVHFAAP